MLMRGQWRQWKVGDPVTVNRIVWDQAEIGQMQDVLDNDWFGPGPKVDKFSRLFADFVDIPYCQPVNSGSSALTLAIEAMVELGCWKPGDYIIHPLLTFPTSITPAIRAGLIPLFVDVDPYTYQIDLQILGRYIDSLPPQISHNITGAIIPHLLGNICGIDLLRDILGDRYLIEDCCDTLGGYYDDKHVGSFGDVAAFSFYGSHHITTGGVGGALVTNRKDVYAYAKSTTHWGRNDYDKLPVGYERFEKRYWYETLGHDFQMTELQAAFGIVQLARIKGANKLRAKRWQQLDEFFRNRREDWFYLPQNGSDKANPSWFAYPIILKEDAPFERKDLAMHLIENKIEIRPIFTGNIMRHPAFKRLIEQRKAIIAGPTKTATHIGENGLFLPAWGMSDGEMGYILEVLKGFFGKI
jgi:CDP-6-deoxy-D-xylo-4-hexulose-3-dehydrase